MTLKIQTIYLLSFTISLLTCMIIPLLKYSIFTKIKLYLIAIATIILFATKLQIIDEIIFNNCMTYFVMANIFVIIFTGNLYVINTLLIIATITTPYFTIKDGKIYMSDNIINKDLWIILHR